MINEAVSIETVLNSRCSCDFDDNPKKNHWGIFIRNQNPLRDVIEQVIRYCSVPHFSNGKLLTWFENGYLFLGFKKVNDPFKSHLLHIESGMQQDAVYLVCTALGLGTCIQNLGIDGTEYSGKIATAWHMILEKADSYENGKFSTAAPGPEKPFKKGKNLSEPRRDGNTECLPELGHLTHFQNRGKQANKMDISQLLWAAKGRTPHYIKSHPWGLTIPTWGGEQNYTSIYLVNENKLFRYINWTTKYSPFWWIVGNPTHDMRFVKKVSISTQLDGVDSAIILNRNENTNRALWEVGYMLENLFLQAKSLGISYKSKIFTRDKMLTLEGNGISEAVAALLLI